MSYKAMAHIHSLNGEMAEITVLEEVGNNDFDKTHPNELKDFVVLVGECYLKD